MKTYSRTDRVSAEIQKELSTLLQLRIKDPRVSSTLVTAVKMSADLRLAKIYFVIPGDPEQQKRKDAENGFQSALGYIKRSLAQQLDLRYMPELKFYYDESFDYGSKIDALLKTVDIKDADNHSTTDEE